MNTKTLLPSTYDLLSSLMVEVCLVLAPDINFFLNSRKQGLPCWRSLSFFLSPPTDSTNLLATMQHKSGTALSWHDSLHRERPQQKGKKKAQQFLCGRAHRQVLTVKKTTELFLHGSTRALITMSISTTPKGFHRTAAGVCAGRLNLLTILNTSSGRQSTNSEVASEEPPCSANN